MKRIILVLTCLPSIVFGQDLCTDWEKRIEPDMQMQEDIFNEENANKSMKLLSKIESDHNVKYEWFEPYNAQKIIKGFKLRDAALKSINSGSKNRKSREVIKFCQFVVEEAFWHD